MTLFNEMVGHLEAIQGGIFVLVFFMFLQLIFQVVYYASQIKRTRPKKKKVKRKGKPDKEEVTKPVY